MHRLLRTTCVVLLLLFIGTICGCTAGSPTSQDKDVKGPLEPARDLGSVEISKYEGKSLTDYEALPDNSIRGSQSVDLPSYRLAIDGAVRSPQRLTYAEVLSHTHYQKLITLHCVEGWEATGLFEGVLMKDLLAQAGPLPSAVTVVFHGQDDYTTSLPLATVLERNMLLVYRVNNDDLIARNGYPFQLAAEDKWGYKWCKWVVRIELSTDPDFKGFWERQGYGNDAEVNPRPESDP